MGANLENEIRADVRINLNIYEVPNLWYMLKKWVWLLLRKSQLLRKSYYLVGILHRLGGRSRGRKGC